MPAQKRKSHSDSFINDSNEGMISKSKRSRPTSTFQQASSIDAPPEAKVDDEGSTYFEISKARRVTVSDFKGKKMISVREYYEKDGKWLPGKKGITMTLEQYSAFVSVLPQIEEVLKESGEEVARPKYDVAPTDGELKTESEEEEDGREDGPVMATVVKKKKPNIDTTSDEEEW